MIEERTFGDIINRFRDAADLTSGLVVFRDEEAQGTARENLESILNWMLTADEHGKKNVDAGLGSTAKWALTATQRRVVQHVLGAMFGVSYSE